MCTYDVSVRQHHLIKGYDDEANIICVGNLLFNADRMCKRK